MRVLPLSLAVLVGCGGSTLAPSVEVGADAMLAALPTDVHLVAGGDLDAVRAAPLVREALARAGVDLLDVDDAIRAGGGPEAGSAAVSALRIGCGDAGCAALLEGDFAGARFDDAVRVGKRVGARAGARVKAARGRLPGVDLAGASGQRYALRVLADDKAVLGDRAAVRAVRRARRGGFDAERLAGDIPAGDVWVAAWDLEALVAQATRRVERVEPGAGARLDDVVARVAAAAPIPLADLDTLALSVTVDGVGSGAEARLRVRCAGEGAALTLAAAMEAAAARVADAEVTVTRDGARVEAAGALDGPAILAILSGTGEAGR